MGLLHCNFCYIYCHSNIFLDSKGKIPTVLKNILHKGGGNLSFETSNLKFCYFFFYENGCQPNCCDAHTASQWNKRETNTNERIQALAMSIVLLKALQKRQTRKQISSCYIKYAYASMSAHIHSLFVIMYLYLHPPLDANRDLTSNLQSRSSVTMPYYNTIRRSKNLLA